MEIDTWEVNLVINKRDRTKTLMEYFQKVNTEKYLGTWRSPDHEGLSTLRQTSLFVKF